jgi:hypothetical protein
MDSAYDARSIHEQIRSLGHIPIIDTHPRRDSTQKAELHAEAKRRKLLNYNYAEDVRYRERTNVERVNARLKDEFGGRMIRVRGNAKAAGAVGDVSIMRVMGEDQISLDKCFSRVHSFPVIHVTGCDNDLSVLSSCQQIKAVETVRLI